MPDKAPEGTETASQNEEDYHLPLYGLPSVREPQSPRTAEENLQRTSRHFRYCGIKNMEMSDSDRPVSFGSTSSSASSRDSHCSFGSRMTLASNSHLGLFHQDKEAGAIKLELVPARQISNDDLHRICTKEQPHGSPREKPSDEHQSTQWKAEAKRSIKCSVTEAVETTSPKLMYVDRVVQEILHTERAYVQDLKSIVEDYLNCISDQSRLSLGTEERSALFGNICDIYHFNSELLQELENCDNDPVAIAECFVSKSEEFHIYTQYCTNYPRSVAILTECMRNKILAKFFRERQEVLQHSLPLGSYLLKPVQRILKYHLLLHEISNHLDKDTEGYDIVLDAIDTMQRVAWHINDMKRKHEHDIRLQEIQSLLTNWKGPDLTSYGELVLEGTFRFQRAKNERTLFLFDRLLLITKKRDDTYTYKAHILCCNLMLVEVIPKEPLSFSVFHYKNPKLQHTVQAKSQQDKRLWILHLKRLILENHPAKIPAKAKQAILEMDAIQPSSNLHKVMKQDGLSPEMQKRSSIQGNLLCQASKLSGSDLLRGSGMRKGGSMNHNSNMTRSQDFYNKEGLSVRLGPAEQSDADDEEESEQLSSQHKIKGGRKRLNSQASENVEKRRSINLSVCESQISKSQSDEESTKLNTGQIFPSSSGHLPSRQNGAQQSNSLIMNILGGTGALRNIWTDHQIRQALFPSRRSTQENEEDDDDYQMFLLSESATRLESSWSQEERVASSRPCSWHLGLMEEDTIPNPSCKIVRRASSVGENKSCSARQRSHYHKSGPHEHFNRSHERHQHFTCLGSNEDLTIDDIEHVYDNISYEDLKQMGFTRRHDSDAPINKEGGDSQSQEDISIRRLREQFDRTRNSLILNKEKNLKKGMSNSNSQELRIIEENIYDSIQLPEQSLEHVKHKLHSKRSNFLALGTDFQSCDQLDRFVSEDSLQFSEDESLDHRVPVKDGDFCYSSSKAGSVSHKSAADKLSEEVDEIWNDLENYIKKNEEKKSERLLASFPVNKDDVLERRHVTYMPCFSKDMEYSLSSLCLPEDLPSQRTILNTSQISNDNSSCGSSNSGSLLSLKRTSIVSETGFLESPLFASNSTIPYSEDTCSSQTLESTDKSKSKVFMMARQYSQKIKKANQLLKMKSPEQEQPFYKSQKMKPKDLAAIMEEKKQGGCAIGARIAEYSQLYDQIIFRDSPIRMQKEAKKDSHKVASPSYSPLSPTCQQPSSPSKWQQRGKCLQSNSTGLQSVNGSGAEFYTWPDVKDFKSKTDLSEPGSGCPHRNITAACSVPSLSKSLQDASHESRWSGVSQQHSENGQMVCASNSPERIVNKEPQLYIRSQSSSSMLHNRTSGSHRLATNSQRSKPILKPTRPTDLGHLGYERKSQIEDDTSDLTLQDSQKVLVMNTLSSLNAQIATLNYYANFKDTDGDDDDDDYVEIKSEDEEDELETDSHQALKMSVKGKPNVTQTYCSTNPTYSFSVPSTPVKSYNSKELSDAHILAYDDADKLNDYLWRPTPSNQQNIVQSLREKFQCLSSSSFA
ncbi:pleckstrin homology domain-containing family G member 1 isoform X3 [Xenopus tropicalis]|uniref:Pleckstrin homology domain-containing family G member 1 isoform X3 n=1 Tax=Xenopus tropicalis TaxID=8364 RepID=A0A8J0T4C1_XENTR|nr:pleckstrin homology domain-containing family G member 1 isoform X3 [Xenopus tropicalis]|eukprot:XP_017949743.1 PREDICTED: pleckstrin homology domain-containing family G member 1 isoform X3 [Xenopus tropicalis]